jgi:hypothetical protein
MYAYGFSGHRGSGQQIMDWEREARQFSRDKGNSLTKIY